MCVLYKKTFLIMKTGIRARDKGAYFSKSILEVHKSALVPKKSNKMSQHYNLALSMESSISQKLIVFCVFFKIHDFVL